LSLLKTIDTNPTFPPRESKALPDRLIAGDPAFKTWAQDAAKGDLVHSGVWEATPGERRSIKGDTFEFCHILSCVIEIRPDGGETVTYRAEDLAVLRVSDATFGGGGSPNSACCAPARARLRVTLQIGDP